MAHCPTEDEPPQMRIGSLVWGVVCWDWKGNGNSRSVVTAWKTVTKVSGSVTVAVYCYSGLSREGIQVR